MTRDKGEFVVALFQSVSVAMKAENALKAAGVSYKLIPVPKEISSECGICVRLLPADKAPAETVFAGAQINADFVDF